MYCRCGLLHVMVQCHCCNNCDGPGCSDENGVAAPCGEIPLTADDSRL